MKYTVIGQRGVLIQLDRYPETSTTTASGIVIPQYKAYETEGGRPAAKIDEEVYAPTGVVLQISDAARQLLLKEGTDPEALLGKRVILERRAKHENNWFFPDFQERIQDWDGKLLVMPNQIQAVYEA